MASIIKRISGRFSKVSSGEKDPDLQKLKDLSKLNYKSQATWVLNAFWAKETGPKFSENADACEAVWKYFQTCVEFDPKGDEGCELDEMMAHRVFERLEKSLTVIEMREAMRKVDVDFNKHVSLIEFLIYKYALDWKLLVNAVDEQGEDMEEVLKETQALFNAANDALVECQQKAEVAKQQEAEAADAASNAKAKEEEACEAEEAQRAEEAKVAAAVAELEAEEKAYNDAVDHLEQQSKRESIGIVKKGKAANELAQLKAQDPIGLQTAKLSAKAALNRQEKATKYATSLRISAQKARESAEKEKEEAEAARQAADEAVEASVAAFKEAEESLERIKALYNDAGRGTFWWMDRELEEAKKYMSKKQLAALEKSSE